MSTTIKHIRSAVSGNTPTTSQLELGVLAINTTDGKVFIKKSVSGTESIVDIGGGTQTAAEILAAIKTVDGTGSGLNADQLGGIQRAGFLRSNSDDTFENILTGNAPIVFDGTLATFDPAGAGPDTATNVTIGLESGHRIAGYNNGYIRTLFQWNNGNDINIGQANTGLIDGINLLPGASGEAKVNGNKIWHAGNHGAGTGLDADTVDGYHSYEGEIRDARDDGDITPTNLGDREFSFTFTDDISGSPNAWDSVLNMKGWSGSTYRAWQLISNASTSAADLNLYFRTGSGSSWGSLQKVWTSGNHGAGTGLDADTVDSIQASSFLRSDAADQKTSGTLKFNDAVILSLGSDDDAELFCDGSHLYLDLNSGIGNFYIRDGTTTRYTFDDDGTFTATGNVTAFSDITLKKNIEVIPNALDKVLQLRGVTFDRKDIETSRQLGVIAQEVEKVCPEVVSTDEDGIKSVAYGNMVGLLIEAVKEQQVQINKLQEKVDLLERN